MKIIDKVIDYITNRVLDAMDERDIRLVAERNAAIQRRNDAMFEKERLSTEALAAETLDLSRHQAQQYQSHPQH